MYRISAWFDIKFGSAQALGQGVVSALGSDLSLYLSSPEIFCPKASSLPQSPCCLAFASVASLLLLEIWNFCWFFKEEKLTKRNKEFSWPPVSLLLLALSEFLSSAMGGLSSSPTHTFDRHSYMVDAWKCSNDNWKSFTCPLFPKGFLMTGSWLGFSSRDKDQGPSKPIWMFVDCNFKVRFYSHLVWCLLVRGGGKHQG